MRLTDLAAALHVRLDSTDPTAPEREISGVAGIEDAGPGQVTFVANPRYAAAARSTRAAAVLVTPEFSALAPSAAALRTPNPYFAFARAIELFYQPPRYAPGVHPTAVIDPSARIGARAHIGAFVCVAAGVVIGDDAVLLPHVVIYEGAVIGHRFFAHAHAVVREHCRLGDGVILQNGAVIGGDGFGFARDDSGRWHKILQSGIAVLGHDVEVQANACVDRASIGETRIADAAKIDNLVQVGHGSSVGERSLLCAQAGLAGSTRVGKDVVLAGQVGVAGHCSIGDRVIATAQSGIPNDVPAGQTVSGYPAMDNKSWLRSVAVFHRLPELAKQLRALEKRS
jgi:UDP-3-O-[3-hydroxymyristoyl] glucosamine N-acyltransferase